VRWRIEQREALDGKEDTVGSGKYPKQEWLGVIQHGTEMFDHGTPRADGTVSKVQRPNANVDVEFQSKPKLAVKLVKLVRMCCSGGSVGRAQRPLLCTRSVTA